MRRHTHRLFLLTIAFCVACKPGGTAPVAKSSGNVPTVRANVVTIRTIEKPEERTLTREIVIVGDRARDTGEQDVWRIFDTKANTVTFVDDIARTYRTESMQSLLAKRRAVTNAALPPHYPRVRLLRPQTRKQLLGTNAELFVIESGTYKRELWIGEHPSIPRGLFAMMYASEPPTLPLAPMMRDVDDVLAGARGFPLADRTEVTRLVIERSVAGVGPKDVPAALLEIPKGYRDTTPAAAPRK
jgi:hypothetical protein